MARTGRENVAQLLADAQIFIGRCSGDGRVGLRLCPLSRRGLLISAATSGSFSRQKDETGLTQDPEAVPRCFYVLPTKLPTPAAVRVSCPAPRDQT
jgi:hypothetical protein